MYLVFVGKKATPWAVYCPPSCATGKEDGRQRGRTEVPGGGVWWGSLALPSLPSSLCHFLRPSLHGAWSQRPSREGAMLRAGPGPGPRRIPPAAVASDRPASLPTVHGIKWTCSNGNSSSGFSVEQLVQQILDSHQTKPQPRTHNCLCTGSLGERGRPQRARGQRGRCQAAGVMTTRGEGSARSQATAQHPGQLSLVLPGGAGAAGGQPTLGRREQFPERCAL